MPNKPDPTPKKASGENIEEWQRGTVQLKLRLRSQDAAWLRHKATEANLSVSAYVTQLLGSDPAVRELTAAEEREAYAADQRHDHGGK